MTFYRCVGVCVLGVSRSIWVGVRIGRVSGDVMYGEWEGSVRGCMGIMRKRGVLS